MSSIEQLEGLAVAKQRLRLITRGPGKQQLISEYAQDMVARDAKIRAGFGDIFKAVGLNQRESDLDLETTKRVNLAHIGEAGKLAIELSSKLPKSDVLGCVDMNLYDGRNHILRDRYETNRVVSMTREGEDYYTWSQEFGRIAGSHYDGYENDFLKLEATMSLAELRQAQIWTALGDASLNPQYAGTFTQQT